MGFLFSDVQYRLRVANNKTEFALKETRDANDKISELYQKTREMDDLKTHFFANISHELRTPLTLIDLSLKKISSGKNLNDEEMYNIGVAEKNVRFLYRHVCDLLDISKLEAKKMSICYTETDIAHLSRAMASQFGTLAEERGIELSIDIPGILFAQVDTEKYQRIILNILSNAFKFTPDNGRISVAVESEEDSFLLRIQDSGPGIPSSLKEQVFERFRQIEMSSKHSHGGTGLGLAIVNEFTLLHGGTVEINDADNGGAVFIVKLPLAAPPGSIIEKHQAEFNDEIKIEAIDELSGFKKILNHESRNIGSYLPLVLVAEDNVDMNYYISSELSKDYRVVSVFNGNEALIKINEQLPDVIITDAMMPEKTGDELVSELSLNRKTSSIPVIMLTAKADDTFKKKMLKSGLYDFVNKPFDLPELVAKIKNVLEERARSRIALEESERRYRMLAENVADVIWIVDLGTCRFRYVSPSVKQLLGIETDDLAGKGISNPLIEQSAVYYQGVLPERVNEFRSGSDISYYDEIGQRRSDSSTVWTETTTRFMMNENTGHLEIYGVTRDITRKKIDDAKLRNALRDRETLIREIYHRTKNNMNVIISLLSLRSEISQAPELTRVLSEVEIKIRVMALVHEKLYSSNDLTYIDLDEFIYDLISLLHKTYNTEFGKIKIAADVEKISIAIETAIPVGLIINELISNSIKHGFSDRGDGNIALVITESADRQITVIYTDNGKGVPDNFDFRNQQSLGIQILFMIVEHQLNGKINFGNAGTGNGLACTVVFENPDKQMIVEL